ncbi:MAG TPA: four helix bundle protein [Chitinophagaceae bacterium]|nr:four helix bundle protein [Chitinophagaceae bacterium]
MAIHLFSFEKLESWQLSRKLAHNIYQITNKFPSEEKFAMVSQLRRAAVSVAANIAEGSTRISPKDQAHFTSLAYSSLMELLNHLIIAFDLGYLGEKELSVYRKNIRLLSVKLSNLKYSQLKRMEK